MKTKTLKPEPEADEPDSGLSDNTLLFNIDSGVTDTNHKLDDIKGLLEKLVAAKESS